MSDEGFSTGSKQSFTLIKDGHSETFKYHQDFAITQRAGKNVEAVWLSKGLGKLERLGLSSPLRAAVQIDPPTVDAARAMAEGKAVAPPAPAMFIPAKTAAPPLSFSPEVAKAILTAAEAGHLMPKPSTKTGSAAPLQFGWDDIVAKLNAETRSHSAARQTKSEFRG